MSCFSQPFFIFFYLKLSAIELQKQPYARKEPTNIIRQAIQLLFFNLLRLPPNGPTCGKCARISKESRGRRKRHGHAVVFRGPLPLGRLLLFRQKGGVRQVRKLVHVKLHGLQRGCLQNLRRVGSAVVVVMRQRLHFPQTTLQGVALCRVALVCDKRIALDLRRFALVGQASVHQHFARRMPLKQVVHHANGEHGPSWGRGKTQAAEPLDKCRHKIRGQVRGGEKLVEETEEAAAVSDVEDGWLQQRVELGEEVGVVEVVFLDQREESLQRKHAHNAARVVRIRQKVNQQPRVQQMWHNVVVHLQQNSLEDLLRQRQAEEADPAVAKRVFVRRFVERGVALRRRRSEEGRVRPSHILALVQQLKDVVRPSVFAVCQLGRDLSASFLALPRAELFDGSQSVQADVVVLHEGLVVGRQQILPVLVALKHDVEQTLEEMVRECMRPAGCGGSTLALGL
eukprot:m.170393 g.170393  ORF g.170393 m.170393 type:complete len:455 (-) comp17249_c0_seq2:417-1781(-)